VKSTTPSQPAVAPVPQPPPLGKASLLLEYFDIVANPSYHFHRTFELVYLQGQAGTRIVGDTIAHYRAEGDLLLVGPLVPHTWLPHPRVSRRYPVTNRVVHFTRESLGMEFLEKPEFAVVQRLLKDAESGVSFDATTTAEAKTALDRLPGLGNAERLLAFWGILLRLAMPRHYHRLAATRNDSATLERDHAVFSGVVQYIQAHPSDHLEVDTMARRVGMSRATFTRFFRRITRTSFIDFVNEWRIHRAAVLLRETSLPILDLALECGYQNLAHFNRQFRKRMGSTPSNYRDQT
jgi:AraC-like DNA-binding protein